MSSATGYVGRRVLVIGIAIGFIYGALLSAAIAAFWWWPLMLFEALLVGAVLWLMRDGGLLDPDRWQKGFEGEAIVSRTLSRLEAFGYELIDDVDIDRGNVDHVIVGPTGVFAIETKNHPGRVEVREGMLRRDGSDCTGFTGQAVRGAMAVRALTRADWVEALLVFPNARMLGGPVRIGTTTVVDLSGLTAFITARPSRLDPDQVHALAGRIRQDQRGRWLVYLPTRVR
ncbi:MAG: nuclease-related domain-containing protein, partial [Actinomycetota bacterium]